MLDRNKKPIVTVTMHRTGIEFTGRLVGDTTNEVELEGVAEGKTLSNDQGKTWPCMRFYTCNIAHITEHRK